MKVDKIQIDMIKAYFKDPKRFRADYHYFVDDDIAYIIYKGVVLYVIPRKKFVLDTNNMFEGKGPFTGAKRLFDSVGDAEELTYAYDKLIDKGTLSIYKNESGEEIALNKRLLKHFEDKKFTPTYKGTNHKMPVFVFDYDVVVGLVFPVAIK